MNSPSERSIEERVAALETEVQDLRDRLQGTTPNPLQTPKSASPSSVAPLPSPITVELIIKSFHKADLLAGDQGDRIDLGLRFTNAFKKPVRAAKGTVVFKDLFGELILTVSLTHEATLPAGGTAVWKGGIAYNQFLPTHQRLLTIKQQDLETSFTLEAVFFTDGTRETFT